MEVLSTRVTYVYINAFIVSYRTDTSMIVATVDGVTCGVISVVDTQIVCKTGAHPGNVKASVSITKLGQGQALYVRIRSCCPINAGVEII